MQGKRKSVLPFSARYRFGMEAGMGYGCISGHFVPVADGLLLLVSASDGAAAANPGFS